MPDVLARFTRGLTFDEVFEHISEGLVVAEMDGALVHWNRAALALHGMSTLAEVCRPMADFLAIYRMATLDGHELPFEQWPLPRLMRGELIEDLELEISRRDRVWSRLFRYGGSLVRAGDGSPRFAVLHIRDVSAQKAAERRLLEENQRQELLLACSHVLLDADEVDSQAVDQIFALVQQHIPVDVMLHFRLLDVRGPLRLRSSKGIPPALALRLQTLEIGQGLCGAVVRDRVPFVADHEQMAVDPKVALLQATGVRACASHPLFGRRGEVLGTLCFASTRIERFGPEQVLFFATLCSMIAVAIERALAQVSLRESESRFRQISEALPHLIWTCLPDGSPDFFAPQWEAYAGHSSRVLTRQWWDLIPHPDDQDGLRQARVASIRAGEPLNTIARLRRHDGQYRWFQITSWPLKDSSGRVVKWFGSNTDIHEARVAHDELAARDARLRVMLDQLPITVWTTDRDLRITFAAGSTLAALDGKPSLIGLHVADSAGPENPEVLALHERALAGETIHTEATRRGFRLRTTFVPLRNAGGALSGVLGLTNDITTLASSQRALEEAEETLRIAQRIGHSGSWSLRFDETKRPIEPMFWSEGMYRLWGVEPGAPIPLGFSRTRVHPEDLADYDQLARRMLSGVDQEYSALFRVLLPDGEVRSLRSHAQPFFDHEGRFVRLIGMNLDVTAQQRAQEEVERLNAGLEATVLARTSELRATNQELESFAYAVSHDLRAPLRAMSGFSRALLEDHGAVLDAEARQFLDHIIAASKTMGELIDGLLTLSRYVRGEFHRERVDLSALATQIVSEMRRDEPDHRAEVSIEPGLVVEGDPRLIGVALRNLLSNAWKYSGRVPAPSIALRAEERGGARWFAVSDNGAGFSMAHAAKLFAPFQRLHRHDEFPGIGIGLATVQRVIHRHGGAIEAEGAPGRGATFRFTLPSLLKTDTSPP
jgi:PAS domain S-box-containing protein